MIRLFFILMLLPGIAAAQVTLSSPKTFGTVTDLRTATADDGVVATVGGLVSRTDGNGGNYMYNASSTAIDDGITAIKPTNINVASPGRWEYIRNQNTKTGNLTVGGTLGVLSYTVTHNLGFVPAQIYLVATSQDAGTAHPWIDKTLITATTFTVKFTAVPILGTNNISIDYLIIKR